MLHTQPRVVPAFVIATLNAPFAWRYSSATRMPSRVGVAATAIMSTSKQLPTETENVFTPGYVGAGENTSVQANVNSTVVALMAVLLVNAIRKFCAAPGA